MEPKHIAQARLRAAFTALCVTGTTFEQAMARPALARVIERCAALRRQPALPPTRRRRISR